MVDTRWRVGFKTTSAKPCAACKSLEASSPYTMIEDTVQKPNADKLRPHPNCDCEVKLLSGNVRPESAYTVTDLEVERHQISEHEIYVGTITHSSSASTPKTVDVKEEIKYNAKVTTTTEYDLGGVDIEASVTASSAVIATSKQSVTLNPGEQVSKFSSKFEISGVVIGTLRDKDDVDCGRTLVGVFEESSTTHFLGQPEPS